MRLNPGGGIASTTVTSFAALDEAVAEQRVPAGTTLEEVLLPERLKAVGEEGGAIELPVSWFSEPEFDGEAAGNYTFYPILQEGYAVDEGVDLPRITVVVGQGSFARADNSYLVGSADDLVSALEKINESTSAEATVVLINDITASKRNAVTEEEKALVAGAEPEKETVTGAVGKHVVFTSEGDRQYSLRGLGSYLVGDVTFDNVSWTTGDDVYANGFLLEFTENFGGACQGYVYGGSDRRAVDSTHMIFNAGEFGNDSTSYGIYGGGYAGGMGRPTGPSLGLDGNPGMPGWTPPEFKAGTGDVNGDVRVEIGGTASLTYLIGGSRNGNVKGDVHITLQADSADERSVGWIAGAGYGNQKGYGNVMGDVTIDALSGNVAYITGTGNQGSASNEGIELGDVDSVAGDVNIVVGQDSGVPMRIRQSGGGTNLLAGCGKPMGVTEGGVAVCGDVNITLNKTAELDDGDMSALYYGTVFGVYADSVVCGSVNIENNGAIVRDLIGAADGAQILGNGREYALNITMNDGDLLYGANSNTRGYIRPYKSTYSSGAETQFKNDVIFEVNGGTLWGAEATEKSKGSFTIDGDFTAIIRTTTKNGLVTVVGGQVGAELTEGHVSKAVFSGGQTVMIDNVVDFDEVIVEDGTTAKLRANNDEDGGDKPYPFAKDDGVPAVKDVTIEEGSVLALYKSGEITGDLTVNGTLALARNSSGVIAPMTAGGSANGKGSLRPINSSTSLFIKSAPKYLEEYVYAQTAGSAMELSLDSSNNDMYFVDRKGSSEDGRDVWFINEREVSQEVTVTFDANGGDTEANPAQIVVAAGSSVGALPTAPTRADYTFMGWNTQADGDGAEFTATTPVTSDITVYAQWEPASVPPVEKYTVTYTDGVDGEEVFPDKVIDGLSKGDATPAFGSDPVRGGYEFIGWDPEVSDTVTGDALYIAQWKKNVVPPAKTYTVTYADGVDGEEVFADRVFSGLEIGDRTPAFGDDPVRPGYKFAGWNPSVLEFVRGDAVYEAVWEKDESVNPPVDPNPPVNPDPDPEPGHDPDPGPDPDPESGPDLDPDVDPDSGQQPESGFSDGREPGHSAPDAAGALIPTTGDTGTAVAFVAAVAAIACVVVGALAMVRRRKNG